MGCESPYKLLEGERENFETSEDKRQVSGGSRGDGTREDSRTQDDDTFESRIELLLYVYKYAIASAITVR